jgi:hypothetical protein
LAPAPLFLNLEDGVHHLGVQAATIRDWDTLQKVVRAPGLMDGYETLVVDTLTKAETFAVKAILKKHGKESLADIPYGKGAVYLWETMKVFIDDLWALHTQGKNVVLVMHDVIGKAPNPNGEDFIRYEVRLQSKEAKEYVRNDLDVLAHVFRDTAVSDEGKAKGNGSVSITTTETPTRQAKSRYMIPTMGFDKGSRKFWDTLSKAAVE